LKHVAQSPPHTLDVWSHTLLTLQHLEQLYDALVGSYNEERVTDLTLGSAVLWLGRYRLQFAEHYSQVLVHERTVRSLLFLAALYHDISKPETRSEEEGGKVRFFNHQTKGARKLNHRGRALALSVQELQRLEMIVEHHMRVHFLANSREETGSDQISRRAIFRFFKDTGAAGIDICLLSLADLRATYGFNLPQELWQAELETCRALLEAYWEKTEQVVAPPRLLSGDDLMAAFGLQPGRTIGGLLGAIRESQAAGEIETREQALFFAERWLSQAASGEGDRPKGKRNGNQEMEH
jgi:putative nucleotidyltransferase with HDIG domain